MSKDIFNKSRKRLIAFMAGLLVISYVQFIHQLGVKPPYKLINNIISPVAEHVKDSHQTIKEKLESKGNKVLKLSSKSSFISQAEASDKNIEASSYIVIDRDSGEILETFNHDKKLPIASITKVMTAVVALDLARADELFTVSKKASSQIPTKLGIPPGQKLTVEELLNAIILTSANDAAEVIKEGIDQKYGEGSFIWAMNEKARFLGLSDTSFENAQGFDNPNAGSSSADVAALSDYALTNYPLIASIAKKNYEFLPENLNHKQFDLYNWNGLLGVYPGVSGLKIGNTGKAGVTTVVAAERNGKKLITVVLGSSGILERDLNASRLLDLGFSKLGIEKADVTQEKLQAKYSTWKYWN